MNNKVKLNDRVTFTMVGFINVLTGFYDEIRERQNEINDYMDVVEMARDYAIDYYNQQTESEGGDA